jgi:hypothetical protein
MPVLAIRQPIEQRAPVLRVENRLAVGAHRFALVVTNDRGIESEPDEFVVTVTRLVIRDPVIPVVDPLRGELRDPIR